MNHEVVDMLPSESSHRQSFIDILTEEIRQKSIDETLGLGHAASRVLLQWLGYDVDNITFIDGSDRGVDAWTATDTSIDIFQVKTHDLSEDGLLDLSPFNGSGISDLSRAIDFLIYEKDKNVSRKELKQLLYRWAAILRNHRDQEQDLPLSIILHLVILGDGLTVQAQQEFATFQASSHTISIEDDLEIQVQVTLHTVDDAVNAKWRQDNHRWLDINKRKCESIQLEPLPDDYISDNANAVFYCRAIDLVKAYEALGYQIFEPNVRANIKSSRVNREIRNSVMHPRTRKEFRFLNNGVTITCDSFAKPSTQKNSFNVRLPGIVNGLQTVVALHDAYQELSSADKEDFEKTTSVLVRLLQKNAVEDITRVVKATNNQNPMKPRNLVSNNPEQFNFARLFANLGWFYEAKEGAWDAFERDHRRWRPTLNKQPKEFQIPNSRKYRRLDNENLAQTWLGFIGFSPEAVNEKKQLFDAKYYNLVFKNQTRSHGFDYANINLAKEEALDQSPNPDLMLVAHLARELASELSLTASENRRNVCERLGLDLSMPKAALDVELYKDNEFILNQALASMSMLFTEYVGFVLFRSLGENIHHRGSRILSNHSFHTLADEYPMDAVKSNIKNAQFEPDDLLTVLWLLFVDTIQDMLSGDWGKGYRAANIKVRFIFSKETRERLYRHILDTDGYMKKRSLKKLYAIGVREGQGLFEFISDCISNS
jgi:hypothetical protein